MEEKANEKYGQQILRLRFMSMVPSLVCCGKPIRFSIAVVNEHGEFVDGLFPLDSPCGSTLNEIPLRLSLRQSNSSENDGKPEVAGNELICTVAERAVRVHFPGETVAPGTFQIQAEAAEEGMLPKSLKILPVLSSFIVVVSEKDKNDPEFQTPLQELWNQRTFHSAYGEIVIREEFGDSIGSHVWDSSVVLAEALPSLLLQHQAAQTTELQKEVEVLKCGEVELPSQQDTTSFRYGMVAPLSVVEQKQQKTEGTSTAVPGKSLESDEHLLPVNSGPESFRVLELGAGAGLAGLAAAALPGCAGAVLTDLPRLLPLLRRNRDLNRRRGRGRVRVRPLVWGEGLPATCEGEGGEETDGAGRGACAGLCCGGGGGGAQGEGGAHASAAGQEGGGGGAWGAGRRCGGGRACWGRFDVILAADVLYSREVLPQLLRTINCFRSPRTKIYIAQKKRQSSSSQGNARGVMGNENLLPLLLEQNFNIHLIDDRAGVEVVELIAISP